MIDLLRLLLSLGLSILAAGLSYRRGLLSESGSAAAVVVGTLTAGVGGWEWGLLLILFFVSSSLLSRYGARRKARFVSEQWEKGDRRDWGQVFANGGPFALLAVVWAFWPAELVWAAAAGALATATGDTWATELGVLSRRAPRLITTGLPVEPGTSGGVTVLGSAAALAGAGLIGIGALLLAWGIRHTWGIGVLPAALVGGTAGVAADSLLGATVQAMRWCPRCGKATERGIHGCGTPTQPLRGWSWLTNDAVNALASLIGGVVAGATAMWLI
ncbi:MAG TPA: DUF92 domain-containing protein [Herpetosiphonaceae bacterium]|nr:DUF92 domain-containing protein [Herpetosiphonaceae bacterium]